MVKPAGRPEVTRFEFFPQRAVRLLGVGIIVVAIGLFVFPGAVVGMSGRVLNASVFLLLGLSMLRMSHGGVFIHNDGTVRVVNAFRSHALHAREIARVSVEMLPTPLGAEATVVVMISRDGTKTPAWWLKVPPGAFGLKDVHRIAEEIVVRLNEVGSPARLSVT